MSEKYFDHKEYRDDLASEIKEESNKDKRRKILQEKQEDSPYRKAKFLHQQERKKFLEEKESKLPVLKHAQEIKETVAHNQISIVVGETGSGKTTQIPLILRDIMSREDKILVTQPRRVAARSVAKYVAQKIDCRIGEEVGYQVRFDDHTTEGTRINFITDGILLRKIQEDPLLREYSVVMVDEAHERSLNIDFALGLLQNTQQKRIEAGLAPIKIIVTSATLEKEKFARYFGGSPVVEVPGRVYPVDIHYEKERVYDYTKSAAEKVKMIVQENKQGDILIFMPGEEEIDKTIKEIEALRLPDLTVLALYGQMSPEEQDKIFEKISGRKVVVATNIAETSVTVPGVRYVIDSGLIKQIEFDHSTGIEMLAIRPHAKSGCIQRAGRAGRIESGECWRLYTESDFQNRQEFQTPEIMRSNIAHIVLTMKKIGIEDVKSFKFVDPPAAEAFTFALDTLKTLGALDENEKITKIGEIMADLPLEPHTARMVVEAEKYKCVETICTIAAFLGGRSVFVRPKGKESEADAAHRHFKAPGSDFLTLLNVWKEYEANHYNDKWARDNFLNSKVLEEVKQIRYQLFRALRRNGIRASESQDVQAIGKSIASGLIENLMEKRSTWSYEYRRVKDNQNNFFIHPSSVTFDLKPSLFVSADIVESKKKYARTIQEVEPEWLIEIAPQLIREELEQVYYDCASDKVLGVYNFYLKGKDEEFLEEKRPFFGQEATNVFAQALLEGKIDMPFVKHNKEVIEKINDLWRRDEGKRVQQLSNEKLKNFYLERLGTIASKQDLEKFLSENKTNFEIDINELVPPEVQEQILRDNPDSIDILGKSRPVQYGYDYWDKIFTASIKIPADDIFQLQEMPVLPSGRHIIFEVVSQEGDNRVEFSGTDLVALQQTARQFLIRKQWDNWRYTGKAPKEQVLENFNPLAPLPQLSEPMQFGVDPQTREPLFAYPAITVETSYYTGNRYSIKYFSSREQAEQEQKKFLEIVEKAKIEQRKKEEREAFLAPVRQLLQKLTENFNTIRYDYEDYGLSYEEKEEIKEKILQAQEKLESETQEKLESETKELLALLQKIDSRVSEALFYKEQRQVAKEKVDKAINEHYNVCPLCGSPLDNGECSNAEHNPERIDFPLDEDGNETGPAILSQIITDQNKIVAQLCVSEGDSRGKHSHYRGDVYLVKGFDIEENGWQGEPFQSLQFEDFGRILSDQQLQAKEIRLEKIRQEKERAKARELYYDALEYAQKRVESGDLQQGRFKKGIHPKTKQVQWELKLKGGGLAIVDPETRQPTTEDAVYFYKVVKTIETKGFRLFFVRLENPFPEDAPEAAKAEDSQIEESSSQSVETSSPETPSLETSLEKLKQRWGAK